MRGLGFYILVSLVYAAQGFPVLTAIIQAVGDVGTAIVPGFCRYKSNNSKTKFLGYLVFPFPWNTRYLGINVLTRCLYECIAESLRGIVRILANLDILRTGVGGRWRGWLSTLFQSPLKKAPFEGNCL